MALAMSATHSTTPVAYLVCIAVVVLISMTVTLLFARSSLRRTKSIWPYARTIWLFFAVGFGLSFSALLYVVVEDLRNSLGNDVFVPLPVLISLTVGFLLGVIGATAAHVQRTRYGWPPAD
jgi:FtsH-binding integral membrane protein